MSKMMVVHLGVIVFAICLSTQVVSQNNTWSNLLDSSINSTTNTYSSSANSTYPTGVGMSLQSSHFSLLLPIVMATWLLHCFC